MLKLQGIAVSAGVTIGEALVLDSEGFRIPRRFVERSAVDTELARLAQAVAETARELVRNRDRIRAAIEAARAEHCKSIGMDLSEEYCGDAVERLRQGVLNFGEGE